MSTGSEDQREQHQSEPKDSDPEYMLKGVQAFGVGIALFAVSIAVAHTAIAQLEAFSVPLALRVAGAMALFVVNIVIAMFGCLAMVLAFSMTGFVKPKGGVPIITWGAYAAWIVFALALAKIV